MQTGEYAVSDLPLRVGELAGMLTGARALTENEREEQLDYHAVIF